MSLRSASKNALCIFYELLMRRNTSLIHNAKLKIEKNLLVRISEYADALLCWEITKCCCLTSVNRIESCPTKLEIQQYLCCRQRRTFWSYPLWRRLWTLYSFYNPSLIEKICYLVIHCWQNNCRSRQSQQAKMFFRQYIPACVTLYFCRTYVHVSKKVVERNA